MSNYLINTRAGDVLALLESYNAVELLMTSENGEGWYKLFDNGDIINIHEESRLLVTDFITDNSIVASRVRTLLSKWILKGFLRPVKVPDEELLH